MRINEGMDGDVICIIPIGTARHGMARNRSSIGNMFRYLGDHLESRRAIVLVFICT